MKHWIAIVTSIIMAAIGLFVLCGVLPACAPRRMPACIIIGIGLIVAAAVISACAVTQLIDPVARP